MMLFPVMLLFCMAGCDFNNGPLTDYDLVYLNGGKLVFYNLQSEKATTFKGEKDSVVNAAYLSNNTLYYNVSSKGNLVLKSLNLDEKKPVPVKVTDWQLKKEECENYLDGNLGGFCYDNDRSKLAMYSEMALVYRLYTKMSVYDLSDKTLKKYTLYDYNPETLELYPTKETPNFHTYQFSKVRGDFRTTEFGDLFFVQDSLKINLTDKLDFREIFKLEPEESTEYVDIVLMSMNPESDKVMYYAMMPWDDFNYSTYCISTIDGQTQIPLYSEATKTRPEWLADGSLVYVAQQLDNEGKRVYDQYEQPVCQLKVMTPDGNIKVLGNTLDFAIKPWSK